MAGMETPAGRPAHAHRTGEHHRHAEPSHAATCATGGHAVQDGADGEGMYVRALEVEVACLRRLLEQMHSEARPTAGSGAELPVSQALRHLDPDLRRVMNRIPAGDYLVGRRLIDVSVLRDAGDDLGQRPARPARTIPFAEALVLVSAPAASVLPALRACDSGVMDVESQLFSRAAASVASATPGSMTVGRGSGLGVAEAGAASSMVASAVTAPQPAMVATDRPRSVVRHVPAWRAASGFAPASTVGTSPAMPKLTDRLGTVADVDGGEAAGGGGTEAVAAGAVGAGGAELSAVDPMSGDGAERLAAGQGGGGDSGNRRGATIAGSLQAPLPLSPGGGGDVVVAAANVPDALATSKEEDSITPPSTPPTGAPALSLPLPLASGGSPTGGAGTMPSSGGTSSGDGGSGRSNVYANLLRDRGAVYIPVATHAWCHPSMPVEALASDIIAAFAQPHQHHFQRVAIHATAQPPRKGMLTPRSHAQPHQQSHAHPAHLSPVDVQMLRLMAALVEEGGERHIFVASEDDVLHRGAYLPKAECDQPGVLRVHHAACDGVLTESATLYGCCITVLEPISHMSLCHDATHYGITEEMYQHGWDADTLSPSAGDGTTLAAAVLVPRTFVLLSRYPFFTAHFTALERCVDLWRQQRLTRLHGLLCRYGHGTHPGIPLLCPPPATIHPAAAVTVEDAATPPATQATDQAGRAVGGGRAWARTWAGEGHSPSSSWPAAVASTYHAQHLVAMDAVYVAASKLAALLDSRAKYTEIRREASAAAALHAANAARMNDCAMRRYKAHAEGLERAAKVQKDVVSTNGLVNRAAMEELLTAVLTAAMQHDGYAPFVHDVTTLAVPEPGAPLHGLGGSRPSHCWSFALPQHEHHLRSSLTRSFRRFATTTPPLALPPASAPSPVAEDEADAAVTMASRIVNVMRCYIEGLAPFDPGAAMSDLMARVAANGVGWKQAGASSPANVPPALPTSIAASMSGCDLSHPETVAVLTQYAVPVLTSYLTPAMLVEVLAAVLTEQTVIFLSGTLPLEVASTCIMAILPLLAPLQWQHHFRPTSPLAMMRNLQIMGFDALAQANLLGAVTLTHDDGDSDGPGMSVEDPPPDVTCVLLDQGKVVSHASSSHLDLPGKEVLCHALMDAYHDPPSHEAPNSTASGLAGSDAESTATPSSAGGLVSPTAPLRQGGTGREGRGDGGDSGTVGTLAQDVDGGMVKGMPHRVAAVCSRYVRWLLATVYNAALVARTSGAIITHDSGHAMPATLLPTAADLSGTVYSASSFWRRFTGSQMLRQHHQQRTLRVMNCALVDRPPTLLTDSTALIAAVMEAAPPPTAATASQLASGAVGALASPPADLLAWRTTALH